MTEQQKREDTQKKDTQKEEIALKFVDFFKPYYHDNHDANDPLYTADLCCYSGFCQICFKFSDTRPAKPGLCIYVKGSKKKKRADFQKHFASWECDDGFKFNAEHKAHPEAETGYVPFYHEGCDTLEEAYREIVNPGNACDSWVAFFKKLVEEVKQFTGENPSYYTEQEDMTDTIRQLLEANLNVILTGAPGTGKTYTAREVAKAFVNENESFERFKQLNFDKETLKKFELTFDDKLPNYDSEKCKEKIFIARVQFHPGYDYSDFVIGMKPRLVGEKGKEQVAFEWKDGIFKKFADRARTVYDEWCNNNKENAPKDAPKFVFIIDEINRADLSRVFGELFSLLEESYRYSRGKDGEDGDEKSDENSITLPNGDEFVIPENLYIIGTMNDIDRSVESMDFALRRRFAWYEVTADSSKHIIGEKVSNSNSSSVQRLKKAMEALNGKIATPELRLGKEYQLGGAIFAKFEKYADQADPFGKLWSNHIENILREYLRGRPDRENALDDLEGVYNEAVGRRGAAEDDANQTNLPDASEADNGNL